MTITDTRVQVQRKGSGKFVGVSGATVTPATPPDLVEITLPETFKLNAGDVLRTVFKVVRP